MERRDWNQRYIDDDTPWDSGLPSEELKAILAAGLIKPCRVFEVGCGTGTNAIFLAQAGFDVTAVDLSEVAINRAKEKAAAAGVKVNFLVADVTALPAEVGSEFPFVFDRGTYHIVRDVNLKALQSTLAKLVAPGGYYLVLAGNANEDAPPDKGPPRVKASDVCAELEGNAFDLVRLKESHFTGVKINGENFSPLAWSGIFRRRHEER
ncbi:MAG: methyltransferase domain-containing protein [Candidatus Obscuribacterales bacterium]|nr:methyltransferase domain-containing protein [Candidatus Obscuribacterales bacterium]